MTATATRNGHALPALHEISDGGEQTILAGAPYTVGVTIRGTAPIIFHRWNCESVEAKSKAAKGSDMKKTDDVESYVYRDLDNQICIPGVYLVGSVTDKKNGAAKYLQDPRSPRKSALDLYKAGVVSLTTLAPINGGVRQWDYIDQRRVTVQQSGITRMRPAFAEGWTATFEVMVLTPEYIDEKALLGVLTQAGRLVGLADYRPTYGRFQVTNFERLY